MDLISRLENLVPDVFRPAKLPGLVGTLAVIVVAWTISLSALLSPWDDLLYDGLVRLFSHKHTSTHEVVLVETAAEEASVPSGLLDTLFASGARHVVVLLPLGTGVGLPPVDPDRLTVARALPRDVPLEVGLGLDRSIVPATLPSSRSGMFRKQWTQTTVDGEARLTLEGHVARQLGRSELPDSFDINFHQGRNLPRLPVVKANSVAALSPIVRGKVVLVGPGAGAFAAELSVPGAGDQALATRAEFHAMGLDTLLQEREVLQTGPGEKLLVLTLVGGLLLLILQPLQLRAGMLALLAFGAVFYLLAALLLRSADIWLPAQAVTIVLVGVFAVVYRDKAKLEAQQVSSLLASLEGKLHHRLLPDRFSESSEHWNHVVNLVDQILQLERSIFLDRVISDHRVKEIAAMNCSLDAIDELRRDYQRAPYTLAIQARGAIVLPANRQFMRTGDASEVQCMAPFLLEGEVLGFWAFGVSKAIIDASPDLLESVNRMAEQIAGLLYQRKLWLDEQERQSGGLARLVRDDSRTRLNGLQQAIGALDRRIRGLESVFFSITTATVMYDLFGRVILINPRMSELLSINGLPPYETTANDLIANLTGTPADEVRRLFEGMVLNEETAQFRVTFEKPVVSEFMLNVRPVPAGKGPESRFGEGGESHPFELEGILFELVDVQELNRSFTLKLGLIDFVTQGLLDEFQQLHENQKQECYQPRAGDPCCDTAGQLHAPLAQMGQRLTELRRLLSYPVGAGHNSVYPLAPDVLLADVMERLGRESQHKQLSWSVPPLAGRALCYANPGEFRQLIESCCERLIDDAVSGSELTVSFTLTADFLSILLGNTGFGMPNEWLQELLANGGTQATQVAQTDWLALCKAITRSSDWGAECSARAALGKGLEFTLRLPRFH